ncbi:MAG: ABC transporter ATP-binding protein, partial [Verrucomicrobiota bacterium]|nr:ABC transporter ATP-binding protein [Verrucomicrobiota bacterium]
VQARILQILRELRNDLGVAVLFVTHDLGVVADVADRVVVMYRGKVVEQGSVLSIFENPSHPYVKGLLACRPTFETKYRILPTVEDFLHAEEAKDGSLTLRERPNAMERLSNLENKHDPKDFRREPEQTLLEVKDLKVHFTSGSGFLRKTRQTVKAVDGVDLSIAKGKTLGLVGESGCGKTTLGRAILGLVHARSGIVRYDGAVLQASEMRSYRKRMQIIFQDPYASLNPRLTIEQALTEPLTVHQIGSGSSDRRERVVSLLEEVGLSSAHLLRYPHEFSGGQRQRLCVARALAVEPEFIVCDECVSAMDVSVQAQVLNLLNELQERRNLTYLFISHDLSVVKFVSDEVAVMQAGRIVETNEAEALYRQPKDPYTQKLLDAVPKSDLKELRERQRRN